MGTSGKWRTGGQVPALAHSQQLQYGQVGYRGQANASGPHASNFKNKGVTSPGHMQCGVAGNMAPRRHSLTGNLRKG
jgi:hypothetical protein